jgi:4-amino-4-deoxy-L-arabinose transferase-like glycosyltransferase
VTLALGTRPTDATLTPTPRESSRRWSRSSAALVALVVGFVAICNFVWIALDHQAPPWDQAHYLHISFQWRHALSDGGLRSFASAFYDTDPTYAPLYMLVITPFEALREGVNAALVANTLMLGGTVAAAAVVATQLFGSRAAFAAALFVGTCPLLYGLSRTPLVETLLVLLVTLSVMAAVLSRGFQRRRWAIVCGVFVGLAVLTKLTASWIVLGPLLCTFALPERLKLRRQVTNAALAVVVAVVVALPWYSVNVGPAIDYARSASSGQLAIGLTGDPLSLDALRAFTSLTINSGVGTMLLLVLVIAGALASRRLLHRHVDRQLLARVAVPASWFVVPFVVHAVSHNQDVRHLAPGIVGVAVLAAGAIAAIRPRVIGTILVSTTAVALVIQSLTFLASFPSTGSASLDVGPDSFKMAVPFDGTSVASARRPGLPDYATPIVRALAEGDDPAGGTLDVCLLDTHQVLNGNTLGYVADSQGVPLNFTDLGYVPDVSNEALDAMLSRCGAALRVVDYSGSGRVAVLNRSSAAARMTPDDLAAFDGPRDRFPVGEGFTALLLRRLPKT